MALFEPDRRRGRPNGLQASSRRLSHAGALRETASDGWGRLRASRKAAKFFLSSFCKSAAFFSKLFQRLFWRFCGISAACKFYKPVFVFIAVRTPDAALPLKEPYGPRSLAFGREARRSFRTCHGIGLRRICSVRSAADASLAPLRTPTTARGRRESFVAADFHGALKFLVLSHPRGWPPTKGARRRRAGIPSSRISSLSFFENTGHTLF